MIRELNKDVQSLNIDEMIDEVYEEYLLCCLDKKLNAYW